MLFDIEKDIFSLLNDLEITCYNSKLPHDFDFTNNIGYFFNIINLSKYDYKNEATLDIGISFKKDKKIEVLKKIDEIDSILLKKDFKNYWLTHKNVWLIKINNDDIDKNTMTYILSYTVHIY